MPLIMHPSELDCRRALIGQDYCFLALGLGMLGIATKEHVVSVIVTCNER